MRCKVHHCISQEMVAQRHAEPPAAKCLCRKYVSLERAKEMVRNQEAKWCVIKRTPGTIMIDCRMCHGDPKLDCKHCPLCRGVGSIEKSDFVEEYSFDVALVSRASVDVKERKYRPALSMKTPRVPTIEAAHIIRAYVSDEAREIVEMVETGPRWVRKYANARTTPQAAQAARERIEEYGLLVLDARTYAGIDRVSMIGVEPADNPDTGEGRRYDYGRGV